MTNCMQCNLEFSGEDQVYDIGDLGADIIALLEQNLGSEVNIEGFLCSGCFETVIQDLSTLPHQLVRVVSQQDDNQLVSQQVDNNCAMCCRSLFRRRCHALGELSRNYVEERIMRQVSDGALVCYSCWMHIYRALRQQGITDTTIENTGNCVWCRRSLARTPRHSVPEGPEHNFIAAQIHPRLMPLGGRVCHACWLAVRRNMHSQQNIDPTPRVNPQLHHGSRCVWCQSELLRRCCHRLLPGPERTEVVERIHPRRLPENGALVCDNCWQQAQNNIQNALNETLDDRIHEERPIVTISLNDFKRSSNSSARCFVPECKNVERNIVPEYLRLRILKSQKVFVMENARICNHHKTIYDWKFLEQYEFSQEFTSSEVEAMLKLSVEADET